MNKLIRFYNQNRHTVWVVVLCIIAIIAVIQILNRVAYYQNNESQNTNTSKYNNSFNYNYSVVSGQKLNNNISEVIDQFIEYCNDGQVEMAYEMLSDDCKTIVYPEFNNFKEKYYNRVFDTKKTYTMQAWQTANNTFTYRVDFTEDMLITGKASDNSILDYYTVVQNNNNEYKLNINKFVGVQNINAKTISENIIINIISKRMYMDYEIYDIEVKNNNQKTIMLDDMKNTDSIYVLDKNEQKYYWYNYEFIESDITVKSGMTQNILIKFNKEYKPNNQAVKLVFKNIALNDKLIEIGIEM